MLGVVVALGGAALACGDDDVTPPRDGGEETDGGPMTIDGGIDGAMPVEDGGATLPRTCVDEGGADAAGTDVIDDANGRASVTVETREACQRTYVLSTTATLRDGVPTSPRRIPERTGFPTTRTGNDMFDALHALALDEMRECSVDAIQDYAFDDNRPLACPMGGCFETGRLWKYVWTRDTAYSVDLGLAPMDPTRSRNSLDFKLSERREGGDLQVVQDTGSGGSYPVSSDRVAWAVGAAALLPHLEGADRDAFRDRALDALSNTIEHDRAVVFDPHDGLYRGEQSFLDWREQSYPEWTADDVVHLAMSKALSTNLLHYRALEVAAELADETGDMARRDRYRTWSRDLEYAIRTRLWDEDAGMFSTFATTELAPNATRRWDLLGSALAVLFGVADEAQATRILASYPHYGPGAPVLFPQQQDTPIYHNRAEWPFVDAYWLLAARAGDNDAVADRMVRALMRGAAVNLSNMENYEAASGAVWVDEGPTSGPVVDSQRQLWSVAGYLAMVHRAVFGVNADADGLHVRPYVTAGMRNGLFAGSDALVLNDYPYRGRTITVVVHLPETGGTGGSYAIAETLLNGEHLDSDLLPEDRLEEQNRVDVVLGALGTAATLTARSDTDWRDVFGPKTPRITSVAASGGRIALALSTGGEAAGDVTFAVYRDGVRVAEGVAGATTSWSNPSSNPAAAASPCYAVETCFTSSGNCSQVSPPACFWGPGASAIQTIAASALANVGGSYSTSHGLGHYEPWGDAGHTLTATGITPARSGEHLFQVTYGNGAGPIDTGITCAVKKLVVEDEASGAIVGEGYLVMPHLGTWDRWTGSSFVSADLVTGHTYRVRIISDDPRANNMSARAHFARYTGGEGGTTGPFDRVNIAELKILAR